MDHYKVLCVSVMLCWLVTDYRSLQGVTEDGEVVVRTNDLIKLHWGREKISQSLSILKVYL
jgi:hypothetical protein